jgi:hypothetical protein
MLKLKNEKLKKRNTLDIKMSFFFICENLSKKKPMIGPKKSVR